MKLPDDYISLEEVQRVCRELSLRDWTQLTDTTVLDAEAQTLQQIAGAEALEIPLESFRLGLQVELEHGLAFPDANVTNNHPILTARIVLAHLKEMLDYYSRLEVAELEGGMLKAQLAGNSEKLAAEHRALIAARRRLSQWEQERLAENR